MPAPVSVTLRRGPLLAPVLARLLGVLGARADLPIDRVNDALLVADAIAAGSEVAVAEELQLSATTEPGRVTLRLGPLPPGGASRLTAHSRLPDGRDVITALCDAASQERDGAAEFVEMRLT